VRVDLQKYLRTTKCSTDYNYYAETLCISVNLLVDFCTNNIGFELLYINILLGIMLFYVLINIKKDSNYFKFIVYNINTKSILK